MGARITVQFLYILLPWLYYIYTHNQNLSAMECLRHGWPSSQVETCAAIASTVHAWSRDRLYEHETVVWRAYVRRIHYTAFLSMAIAHATWVVNVWPTDSRAYRTHRTIASWLEIATYALVGGVVAPCVVMLTYPGVSATHNRSALVLMTVCLLFLIKGFTQLVVRVAHNRYVGAFQWTHYVALALLLFSLDQGESLLVSELYKFSASCYSLAVAFAFHRQQVRVPWMKRAAETAQHVCLFAAHVMLTSIGGEGGPTLQWSLQETTDAALPIWRVLVWDWSVVGVHFIVQLALLVYALCEAATRRKRKAEAAAYKYHVAFVSTVVKLMVAFVLLLLMLLLLTVDVSRVTVDWDVLTKCKL